MQEDIAEISSALANCKMCTCTLLHITESGRGPQILINSPKLYFQGWINLNWTMKIKIAINFILL